MNQRTLTVAVAANFTPDLVRPAIAHWLGELGIVNTIEIAPYNQLFQELIDPASLFGRARSGINVALIRLGDWARREGEGHARQGAEGESAEALARNVDELIELVSAYAVREGAAPLLVMVCPEPPATRDDASRSKIFADAEQRILGAIGAARGALAIGSEALLAAYPTEIYDDPASDELGHIPYTQAFSAAIGTVIARKIRAYVEPPHKVLALDCDNTIWSGVVGEDGAAGVVIDAGRAAIQRFAVAQHEAGVLVCLASKNVDEDVDEVFRTREMPLEKRHILASRVNWQPKSQNLRELAQELNLGLDSFVFVDDSRVECAEVRAGCPDVLTVELPADSAEAARVITNVWAFDRWKITAEDQKRGELYRQNLERTRTLRAAPSMDEFLASLNLQITVAPPTPAEIPRTAQLTFRTNQFNTTTVRRAEAELASLLAAGKIEALAVTVADRFGDYGLVGVALFDVDGDAIRADTFLLSCRVLQRGVEHRMVARLGEIAVERGLGHVTLPFVPTAKNLPARDFLRSLGEEHLEPGLAGAFTVRLPAAVAAALVYRPSAASPSEAANQAVDDAPRPATSGDTAPAGSRHALFERLAREVHTAEQIQAIVQPERGLRRRSAGAPAVPPRDALEHELARLCEEVIGVQPIGVTDDLFLDFGADSLAGVRLAKAIGVELGHRVEVVTVLEARTVERLARAIRGEPIEPDGAARPTSKTLYTYRSGGSRRPLFLVRPASSSGGSLSYVALARSVDRARPLHTFLNRPLLDGGAPYASIEAMAGEYVAALRAEQPRGPYLLAGWCLGGKVAFEMANQLVAAGEEVATLVLFDTLPPASRIEQLRRATERATKQAALAVYSRFPRVVETRAWKRVAKAVPYLRAGREKDLALRFQGLAYWAHERDDAALVEFSFPGMFDRDELRRLAPEARWEHVFTELKKRAPGGGFDGEISGATMRRGYGALAWDHRLDAAYAPTWSYPGEVHLFTVRGGGAARARGWQSLCARRIEEHEFPIQGTTRITDPHNAMMQRENVPLFADALNRVLDAADARAGRGR